MTEPARDEIEHAHALLAELTGALFTTDPQRRQIVLPSADPQAEVRSQVGPASAAIVGLDEQGIIIAFNEAAERLFGHSRCGAVGQPAALLFTTAGAAETPALTIAEQAGSDGVRKSLSLSPGILGRQRHGPPLPLSILVSELTLAGQPGFVLLIHSLMAQQERAKSQRAAEARYRALVEQIPAVTFMASLDEGDNEMYVSPQIEALLGYSQKEWLDDPVLWFSRLHPDDRELWNQEFARGIATGGPFLAECRVLARDGRVVWIHGEARLVRDSSGRPLFLQGIAFDISESKRAAQESSEAQQSKARHERLAAVGQLAASIGHDLRNPLAAIRNAHYYVSRRLSTLELGQDTRIASMLQIIDKELAASGKILSDLLDFARDRKIDHVTCALSPLVDDALSIVPVPTHVRIHNEVADTLPMLDLDRDQMRQVLVNLVQNAAEAIPTDRAGTVVISGQLTDSEVLLSIRDNGEGIPAENLDKILEPLFTTKARGTGLGLAIVSNIIKRHDGTLQIQSQRNLGTTFTIHLPRPKDQEPTG